MSIIDILTYFLIYSVIGWMVEVAFHAVTKGKFINRGMLNGPYCPIYGFGVVGILLLLEPYTDNFFLVFIGAMVVCTLIEFFGGFFLDKIFHLRWWDYSKVPFNIGGYICLSFSIYWGLGGAVLVDKIHPLIRGFVSWVPSWIQWSITIAGLLAMGVDLVITVATILKWNRLVTALSEEQQNLKELSDKIGSRVAKDTLVVGSQVDKTKEGLELRKQEFQKKISTTLSKMTKGNKRRMRVFPSLRGTGKLGRNDVIQLLKEELHKERSS